jgi:hypothetical protein
MKQRKPTNIGEAWSKASRAEPNNHQRNRKGGDHCSANRHDQRRKKIVSS